MPRIIVDIIAVTSTVVLAYYAVSEFLGGFRVVAALDALALVAVLASMLVQRFKPHSITPSLVGMLAVSMLFFYLLFFNNPSHTGFLWFFVLPPLCVFMLGTVIGSVFFVVVYVIVVAAGIGLIPGVHTVYSPEAISRFLIALFITFALSASFEVTRRRAFILLESKNEEQASTLAKMNALSVELKESEALHRALIERANDGIVLLSNGIVRMCNEKMAKMIGYQSDELVGKRYSLFVDSTERERIAGFYRLRMSGADAPELYETLLTHKDGYRVPVEVSAGLIHFDRQPADFIVVRDISARKKFEDELRYLAYHDPLTGLGNRKALYERLDAIMAGSDFTRESFHAVLYLDLDGFKSINDTYGHAAGDTVLQTVASRLQEQVRVSDDVFRIGGDEFVVIVSSLTRSEDAGPIAAKLIQTVSRPLAYAEKSCRVTTSVGICSFASSGADAETLLHLADQAMFMAKRQKNRYEFAISPAQRNTCDD